MGEGPSKYEFEGPSVWCRSGWPASRQPSLRLSIAPCPASRARCPTATVAPDMPRWNRCTVTMRSSQRARSTSAASPADPCPEGPGTPSGCPGEAVHRYPADLCSDLQDRLGFPRLDLSAGARERFLVRRHARPQAVSSTNFRPPGFSQACPHRRALRCDVVHIPVHNIGGYSRVRCGRRTRWPLRVRCAHAVVLCAPVGRR